MGKRTLRRWSGTQARSGHFLCIYTKSSSWRRQDSLVGAMPDHQVRTGEERTRSEHGMVPHAKQLYLVDVLPPE